MFPKQDKNVPCCGTFSMLQKKVLAHKHGVKNKVIYASQTFLA